MTQIILCSPSILALIPQLCWLISNAGVFKKACLSLEHCNQIYYLQYHVHTLSCVQQMMMSLPFQTVHSFPRVRVYRMLEALLARTNPLRWHEDSTLRGTRLKSPKRDSKGNLCSSGSHRIVQKVMRHYCSTTVCYRVKRCVLTSLFA